VRAPSRIIPCKGIETGECTQAKSPVEFVRVRVVGWMGLISHPVRVSVSAWQSRERLFPTGCYQFGEKIGNEIRMLRYFRDKMGKI